MSLLEPFTDEQARTIINLEQRYENWIEAERTLAAMPYDMRRKDVGAYSYLYELTDRRGNGTSVAPWSPEAETRLAEFRARRDDARIRRTFSGDALEESCRLYKAVRLPQLASEAGTILREADKRGLLGAQLLVVGTNAMLAYAIEANGFIREAPFETEDFDPTWAGPAPEGEAQPFWALLRAVDPSFTINTERPFQARNAKSYEVELLAAPSAITTMARTDQPRPIPLPEQEWLLLGRRIDRVVVCRDGAPARLVVPDPRWFALHKLWLAEKPSRNSSKRDKDATQGAVLLDIVWTEMPHYPLDDDFARALPPELAPYFDRWAQRRPARPERRW